MLKKFWLCSYLLFLCLNPANEQLFFAPAHGENRINVSAHYVFAYLKNVPCLPSSLFKIAPGDSITFLRADVYDGFFNTVLPTDIFTIPEKGAYLISYGASVRNQGAGMELQVNGSAIPGSFVSFQKEAKYTEISIIIRLEQGDLISLNNPAFSPPLKLVNPDIFPFTDDDVCCNDITEYCASLMIIRISP